MTAYTITPDPNFPTRRIVTRSGTRIGLISPDICNGHIKYSATSLNTNHGFVGRYDAIDEAATAIANTWPTDRSPTMHATALPLTPARLADLLLTPGADANTLHRKLADQVGARPARWLLAAAHDIVANRLWNAV